MRFTPGEIGYTRRLLEKLKETADFSEDYIELYGEYDEPFNLAFSSLHASLNGIFQYMNHQIHSRYFHAEPSREAIRLFDIVNNLTSNLSTSGVKLDPLYTETIVQINKFIQQYRGTTVPEDFNRINIIEVHKIFRQSENYKLHKNKNSIFNLKAIGKGSYAEVYKFKDTYYDTFFALKRASKTLEVKEIERFKREFETMQKLNSPYIVKVYSYNDEAHEYTMELIDYTVHNYLQKFNNLLIMQKRVSFVNQILKAFEYIHSKGYFHRDISTSNILIKKYDDAEIIKISDFGLVKTKESTLTSLNTELKGSLNDPDLEITGFANYEIKHEIYALTKLITIILSGKTRYDKIEDLDIITFLKKGTSTNNRFISLDELSTVFKLLSKKLIAKE